MTTTLSHPVQARPGVRPSGPSLPALVGLEARKSLSTRSGKAVALATMLIPPAVAALLSLTGEELPSAVGPIAALGLVSALLLVVLGVLSTAGEWTHRTVQTTFLLVPQRGRVVAAKGAAMALLGAAFAAVSTALVAGVLAVAPVGDPAWDGVPWAMGMVVAAGAAFAVTGAGVGAAVGNSPAALTGFYLTVLGAMPVLRVWRPEVAEKLDPVDSVLGLANGTGGTTPALVLAGWVVVASVAGWVLTSRRPAA